MGLDLMKHTDTGTPVRAAGHIPHPSEEVPPLDRETLTAVGTALRKLYGDSDPALPGNLLRGLSRLARKDEATERATPVDDDANR